MSAGGRGLITNSAKVCKLPASDAHRTRVADNSLTEVDTKGHSVIRVPGKNAVLAGQGLRCSHAPHSMPILLRCLSQMLSVASYLVFNRLRLLQRRGCAQLPIYVEGKVLSIVAIAGAKI